MIPSYLATLLTSRPRAASLLLPAILLLSLQLHPCFALNAANQAPFDATPDLAYYYDLNTGQLFASSSLAVPPIKAPSGDLLRDGLITGENAGVRAYVFSCTSCDDEAGRTIQWLETFTPETKDALQRDGGRLQQYFHSEIQLTPLKGQLVAEYAPAPASLDWVEIGSEAGVAIVAGRPACPDDAAAQPCVPTPAKAAEPPVRETPRGYIFAAIGAAVLLLIVVVHAAGRRMLAAPKPPPPG